jgi:hypothetical protein
VQGVGDGPIQLGSIGVQVAAPISEGPPSGFVVAFVNLPDVQLVRVLPFRYLVVSFSDPLEIVVHTMENRPELLRL